MFQLIERAILLAGPLSLETAAPHEDILSPLQSAAERADPHAAIEFYGRLIADPPWFGAQYVVYRRDALIQQLVMARGQEIARELADRLDLALEDS